MRLLFGTGLIALLLVLMTVSPTLACSGATAGTLAHVMRDADVIALVEVVERTERGTGWDYTLRVERAIKGDVGASWTITGAGASDCGMGRLDAGQRVVLEYWAPGQFVDDPPRPWFFDWRIDPDGSVHSDAIHDPSPTTLTALLSAYEALLPPNTSTAVDAAPENDADRVDVVLAVVGAIALLIGLVGRRRLSRGGGSAAQP